MYIAGLWDIENASHPAIENGLRRAVKSTGMASSRTRLYCKWWRGTLVHLFYVMTCKLSFFEEKWPVNCHFSKRYGLYQKSLPCWPRAEAPCSPRMSPSYKVVGLVKADTLMAVSLFRASGDFHARVWRSILVKIQKRLLFTLYDGRTQWQLGRRIPPDPVGSDGRIVEGGQRLQCYQTSRDCDNIVCLWHCI